VTGREGEQTKAQHRREIVKNLTQTDPYHTDEPYVPGTQGGQGVGERGRGWIRVDGHITRKNPDENTASQSQTSSQPCHDRKKQRNIEKVMTPSTGCSCHRPPGVCQQTRRQTPLPRQSTSCFSGLLTKGRRDVRRVVACRTLADAPSARSRRAPRRQTRTRCRGSSQA